MRFDMPSINEFKVVYKDKAVMALGVIRIGFGEYEYDLDSTKRTIKPKFIDVLVINSDGNIEIIRDETCAFRFIPAPSLERGRKKCKHRLSDEIMLLAIMYAKNTIVITGFIILAVIFKHWWIALCSIIFMSYLKDPKMKEDKNACCDVATKSKNQNDFPAHGSRR